MKQHMRATLNGKNTMTTGILIGTAVAIIISLLLSAGVTSLILNRSIPEKSPGVYTFLIRSLSVLSGGLLATAITKEKSLQVVGIVTGAYLIALLASGIIFYNGSFHNFGFGLLSVITGGGIACIIKVFPRKKRYHLPKFTK